MVKTLQFIAATLVSMNLQFRIMNEVQYNILFRVFTKIFNLKSLIDIHNSLLLFYSIEFHSKS